jgi:hypothetical protein
MRLVRDAKARGSKRVDKPSTVAGPTQARVLCSPADRVGVYDEEVFCGLHLAHDVMSTW